MFTSDHETFALRLNGLVAVTASLVFASLAIRHVGESVFLEDQVDQLQNFEALLRLEPEGLWGAIMSDTRPPVRTLGPAGAIVFGLPVALGLGIDSIHFITSLLITIAAGTAFTILARIDRVFAWLWFIVFSATGIVWWNTGLLWTNTLLLAAGLAVMAVSASCLSRPRLATLALLLCVVALALHLHLVAIVSIPVVLVVMAASGREAWAQPPSRTTRYALACVAIAAVLPYVLAELLTGFQNTRAILSHIELMRRGEPERGVATAIDTLSIAADPARVLEQLGIGSTAVVAIGAVIAAATLVLYRSRLRRRLFTPVPEHHAERVILWLVVGAVAAILGQALFFIWTARPLAGFHYVSLLTPFYAVVPAALLREAVSRFLPSRHLPLVLGAVCVTFLLWMGPSLADRFLPQTQWSYQRITAGLDTLCAGIAVDTDEGQSLAAQLNPKHDSVLRYLMNRGFSTCRFEPGSPVLIVAAREGKFDEWHTVRETRYRLEAVQPPGIARYRRWP